MTSQAASLEACLLAHSVNQGNSRQDVGLEEDRAAEAGMADPRPGHPLQSGPQNVRNIVLLWPNKLPEVSVSGRHRRIGPEKLSRWIGASLIANMPDILFGGHAEIPDADGNCHDDPSTEIL